MIITREKIATYNVLNFIWNILIISQNAIAVIIGGWIAITYGQVVNDDDPANMGNVFTLLRNITPRLPAFETPQFSVVDSENTVTKTFSVSVHTSLYTSNISQTYFSSLDFLGNVQ